MSKFSSQNLTFIEVGFEHAAVLAEIHRRCFPGAAWSCDSIKEILVQNSNEGVIYCENDMPLGFVLWQRVTTETEILTICIDPEWQGKGYSRLLVVRMLKLLNQREVKKIFLEVAEDNITAISLYLSVGFVEIARRPKYYQKKDGISVDAMVMQLDVV